MEKEISSVLTSSQCPVVDWSKDRCLEWLQEDTKLHPHFNLYCTAFSGLDLNGSWLLNVKEEELKATGLSSLLARTFIDALDDLKNAQIVSDFEFALNLQLKELDEANRNDTVSPKTLSSLSTASKLMNDEAKIYHQDARSAFRAQYLNDNLASVEYSHYKMACDIGRERPLISAPVKLYNNHRWSILHSSKKVANDKEAVIYIESDNSPKTTESSIHGVSKEAEAVIDMESDDGFEETKSSVYGYEECKSISKSSTKYGDFNVSCIKCNTCLEYTPHGIEFPCSHGSCIPCLQDLFKLALTDISLIPVRCCKTQIDPNIAQTLLKGDDLVKYNRFYTEKTAKSFMYCVSSKCSAIILLDHLNVSWDGRTECHVCSSLACSLCKSEYHPGIACDKVKNADISAIEFALQKGWQRCNNCGHLVELKSGCNHMTCLICHYEFCYVCARKWKTCSCSLWDEQKLTTQAEQDVGAAVLQQMVGINYADIVKRVLKRRNELLNHDDCNHKWRRVNRPLVKECQCCNFILHVYCYECSTGCNSVVCHTCRFFRLG